MSRTLCVMVLALVLASCSGGYKSSPRNMDNACSIVKERPRYLKAFKAAERKWGVPIHVQMATIYQESKFRSNARTPFRFVLGVIPMGRQSSAYGYSQALDGTWEQYRAETGSWAARRNDIKDAADFMGWYMNKSQEKNGIPLDDARRQYLAYHEGHTGYARGSHRRKSWLMRVSSDVQTRAVVYEGQLATCRGIRL